MCKLIYLSEYTYSIVEILTNIGCKRIKGILLIALPASWNIFTANSIRFLRANNTVDTTIVTMDVNKANAKYVFVLLISNVSVFCLSSVLEVHQVNLEISKLSTSK